MNSSCVIILVQIHLAKIAENRDLLSTLCSIAFNIRRQVWKLLQSGDPYIQRQCKQFIICTFLIAVYGKHIFDKILVRIGLIRAVTKIRII